MSDDTCGRYDPSPDDADSSTFSLEQEAADTCTGPVSPVAPAEGERYEDEDQDLGGGDEVIPGEPAGDVPA